jgi:hypothetical protein
MARLHGMAPDAEECAVFLPSFAGIFMLLRRNDEHIHAFSD